MALKGDRFDGHTFLAEASAKGAAAAVVRKGTTAAPGLPLFEVEDTLGALGALAAFHRRRFSIPVAAVGGSAGKTTTKEMVAAILRTRGPALATEGNFNNEIGVPLTLLRLGREHRAAVVELGMSTPGELARITRIARPDAAVLTLVAAEHLEFLKDLDGVAEAEGELYRGLLPGSVAVVNADDARCVAQAERVASGVKKIFFGKSALADVRLVGSTSLGVEGLKICLEGEEGLRGAGGERRGKNLQRSRVDVRLGFVGEHNAMNAAAAAALALSLSYTFEEISVVFLWRGRSPIDCESWRGGRESRSSTTATTPRPPRWRPRSRRSRGSGPATRAARSRCSATCWSSAQPRRDAHRTLGQRRVKRVDAAAFFGPRSLHSFEEFSSSASSSSAHFTEIEPLLAWLRPRLQPGDTVLVKGSRGMKLERVVDALVAQPA